MHEDISTNKFPTVKPSEAMSWSYNLTVFTMLRNIIGSPVEFGLTLRRLAYRSYTQNRPLRVLEVTYGIPSIALELLSPRSFRSEGDYLQCYGGSKNLDDITAASNNYITPVSTTFTTPDVQITTVSPKDYILDTLSGNSHGFDWSTLQERMSAIFYRDGQDGRRADKGILKRNYEEAKSQGSVCAHEGNIVSLLKLLSQKGERYDLVVCNQLMYSEDRVKTLEALQSVISIGGIAYVPLTWWSPKFEGGVHEGTLLADVVKVDGQDFPLEEYLAQNYSNAFEVRPFSGPTKTLIVKGTKTPIKLPNMNAEIVKLHVSAYSRKHAYYYPDMPVMRWRLD